MIINWLLHYHTSQTFFRAHMLFHLIPAPERHKGSEYFHIHRDSFPFDQYRAKNHAESITMLIDIFLTYSLPKEFGFSQNSA